MARFLWTQKEDIGPAPRLGHAMAFDVARARTLLFGGDCLDGGLRGDSWTWDGEAWTQVADMGPSGRRFHSLAFEAGRNRVLLFGGADGSGLLGDTWAWDGADWTQLEDSGPSARQAHSTAFDAARGRIVLFGGNPGSEPAGDTWEWDGESWTQVEDSGPPARSGAAMAYDQVRQRTFLFGGDGGDGIGLSDTWSWDGQDWTQVADMGPPGCMDAAMVSTGGQLVLFGGISSANSDPLPKIFDDSWGFDGTHWTQRQDIGPRARHGHAMAFDSARRTIVLFGGRGSFGAAPDLLGDTWEHVATEAPPGPGPGPAPNYEATIVQLDLIPTAAAPGETVRAQVTLASAPPDNFMINLAWVRQSIFEQYSSSGTQIPPEEVHALPSVLVPVESQTGTADFPAPAAGESVMVAAFSGSSSAVALLTMT